MLACFRANFVWVSNAVASTLMAQLSPIRQAHLGSHSLWEEITLGLTNLNGQTITSPP
jgi:hypothetical protein